MSKFQILSFIYIPNFKRCSLSLKLTSFILIVIRYYMVCPSPLTSILSKLPF
ncbi:hypothetical protein HanIR_Chr11g0557821 [Helianthus annuus]|nr:hypothetical protein HanIR_Chr11g0557821 [Helianthus annuus]